MPPEPENAQNCAYCNEELKNLQGLLGRANLQNTNKKTCENKPNITDKEAWTQLLWYAKIKKITERKQKQH